MRINTERKLILAGLIVLANVLGFTGQFDKMTIGISLVCVAAYLIIEWRKPLPKIAFEVFPAIAPKFGNNRYEWVYVIQDIEVSGYCKIGYTTKPKDRFEMFDVKLPFKWQFVALMPCTNARALEHAIHKTFADRRVNGEWFNLDAMRVNYLKEYAARLEKNGGFPPGD